MKHWGHFWFYFPHHEDNNCDKRQRRGCQGQPVGAIRKAQGKNPQLLVNSDEAANMLLLCVK